MFIYQLGSEKHMQTGLVCEVSVEDYENGTLRKHENTRAEKEDLLAQYQEVVGASTDLARFKQLFEEVQNTYLTDGHHRAASGYRYAEIMRAKSGSNNGDEPFNQLLIALFPDNQLNLLPFHRSVRDSNGLSAEQIAAALEKNFEVEHLKGQTEFTPAKHGEFGMLAKGQWYKLAVRAGCIDSKDPVGSLDVSILQNHILDPVLGIKDMRDDPRLGYVAGVAGIEGIRQAADEGWEVIFVCYATSIQQLMDVADADALMPPKSTYFDPKPRSGIFVRLK